MPTVSAAVATTWQMLKKLGLSTRVPHCGEMLSGNTERRTGAGLARTATQLLDDTFTVRRFKVVRPWRVSACSRFLSPVRPDKRSDGRCERCRRMHSARARPLPVRRLDLHQIQKHASATVRSSSYFDSDLLGRQGRYRGGRNIGELAKSFERFASAVRSK